MIDELPDAPDPATDSPAEFSTKAAASVLAQQRMVGQFNSELGALNALFAGGAYAFMYAFDSGTTDADPGNGRLRLNSATQNIATVLRADQLAVGGANIAGLFDSIGTNTSALKGAIRIVKAQDPTKWMLFDILAVASASGYRNFTIAHRAGSSASPFVNNDPVMVYFDRAGERGTTGTLSMVDLASRVITTPVVAVDHISIFTDDYDFYEIDLSGIALSVSGGLNAQFIAGGSVVSAVVYGGPYRDVTGTVAADTSSFGIGSAGPGLANSCSFTLEIRGARNPNTHTGFGVRGFQNVSNSPAVVQEGRFRAVTVIDGIRLVPAAAGTTITAGEVTIRGRRRAGT